LDILSAQQNALEEIFSGKKRVVICGIGNDIRGDDAFGVLVAEGLRELAGRL